MCWIHHAITCRAKNLIFGRKWSTCFEIWSFNLCMFVFVPWRPWVLWNRAPKEHNNTSTGLLSLRAVAQTGGPDLPGWSWSWGLIYIIIIFDTNQEICPWKKNFKKTNKWIRQVRGPPRVRLKLSSNLYFQPGCSCACLVFTMLSLLELKT